MVNVVTYEEVKELASKKTELIIDVREPKELEDTGKIPGSINIPLADLERELLSHSDEFLKKFGIEKPDKSAPITVHCKMGGRSLKACKLLEQMGYTNLKNYSGGWSDWKKHLD
ncbi:rhodanese domain-containing protein CG4456-like [Cylas formicarius]|uniref:rhodanese domain-containing protein CG4456-like n=1 Tax=Cylas formicarius TaxID=197179 RepID=UPI00295848A4|nr:rhodanese domain-containing protein CG4456-like [Cylas formicarius]